MNLFDLQYKAPPWNLIWIIHSEEKILQTGIRLTCVTPDLDFPVSYPRVPFHQSEAVEETGFRVQNHSQSLFLVVGSLAKFGSTKSITIAAP
jgi:hypothetical protein